MTDVKGDMTKGSKSADPATAADISWRRRAVQLGRRLGLPITDVGPGVAVLGRSAEYDVTTLVPSETYLVNRRGKGVAVAKAGAGGWLVTPSGKARPAALTIETQALKLLGARHISWLLKRYRIDCVLDVGANTGQFAKELRRNGFQGYIHSFEPVPAFVERLQKASADDEKWTIHQMALGSTEGTVPMHVQKTLSSLLPSTDYGRARFKPLNEFADTEPIDVPLRRLDTIFDELLAPVIAAGVPNPRVFLKMDTQGFDLEAFRGLGERVKDIIGLQSEVALLLIYEQMPRMPEAIAVYEAAGFEVSGLFPVTRERDGRVIEYDCAMVRASELPD